MNSKQTRQKSRTMLTSLMALFLFLSLLPWTTLAQEKEVTNLFGSELMDTQDSIRSAVVLKDRVYILTNFAFYTWQPGDERAKKHADLDPDRWSFRDMKTKPEEGVPIIDLLITDGERLLALDGGRQALFTLTLEGDDLVFSDPLKLDLEEFIVGDPPYQAFQQPEWMQVIGDKLYYKAFNYDGAETDLYTYDLKTGEKATKKTTKLAALSPYKEGQALTIQVDMSNRYDPQTGAPLPTLLQIYDLASDTLSPTEIALPTDNSGNTRFYYDQGENALFTATDSDIYRIDVPSKEQKLIGYLPMFSNYSSRGDFGQLSDGRLVIGFSQNIFLRESTEKGLLGYTVLRSAGYMFDNQITSRVLMEMDKVVLRRVEGLLHNNISEEELATMFLTRNVPVDLLTLSSSNFDIEKLIQKGYVADLSGSEKIQNYVKGMLPNLTNSFLKNGKTFALPVSLMAFPISAYTNPLQEVGIAMPATLQEYVDLAIRWVEGLGDEHPEYTFASDSSNLKRSLISQVIERYTANLLGSGQDLTFDTPVFREMIQKILATDFGDYGREINWESPEEIAMMESMWEKKALFESGMGYEPQYAIQNNRSKDGNRYKILITPHEEGQKGYLDASMSVMALMETSPNKEAAISFMEHYLSKMDELVLAAFDPAWTAEIPNPSYEKDLAVTEKSLNRLKEQMDKAQGAEKSNLEQSIKYMQEHFDSIKETGRLRASTEEIKEMHEIFSHFFLFSGLGNAQRRTYWREYELVDQMMNGVISLDQFIKQIDDKLRLVRMEYQ